MAAGLTVERGKLGQLRQFFEERAETAVRDLVSVQTLKVDGALAAAGATLDLVRSSRPGGTLWLGHPQPLFGLPATSTAR